MREVVHHIDGQPDRLGARRHRNADVAGAGAENGNDAREVGRERIARSRLDPRCIRGIEASKIVIAICREPANPRRRRCHQPPFCAHEFAGSDEQHHAALQIEKHGQESHAILATPTSGVDWNYFLYMCRSTAAKRKLFLLYCVATIEFSPSKAKAQRCIFSTPTPRKTGRVSPTPRMAPPSRIFLPTDGCRPPRWTTSTNSRRRASTFCARRSHG